MKLALHRSITFWSGILVMAFICWAWRDSVFWNSSVSKSSWRLNSSRSGVSVYYVPPPASFGEWRSTRFKATPTYFSHQYLPPALFARGAGVPQGPIEVADDGSVSGPPEYLAWQADMQAARSERERFEVSMRHRPVKDGSLFVPYWLFLLAVAVPWLALPFWRARRRGKTAAAIT
ncbi:hypothetical protein OKA05_10565 [Luteolibacter arcticus]|uniref:DUF3592 domain-containing protein n=1 Tax=Luteolibacter arcticus TaxID=1581411 RepID=A0ABT3GHD0_9BACT|nr:hypothetical protein [Luteolibacter arcticus]MCW1922995.1 hypothetical protein [Luteolibacter arcticus]